MTDSTAKVRRYEYDADNEHMTPELFGTVNMVTASDHEAALAAERANSASALAERDARIAELERFRSVDAGVEVLLRHHIAALEAGLRKIVARWPSTTNPNCDDYERGYGQATSDIAQIARALLTRGT